MSRSARAGSARVPHAHRQPRQRGLRGRSAWTECAAGPQARLVFGSGVGPNKKLYRPAEKPVLSKAPLAQASTPSTVLLMTPHVGSEAFASVEFLSPSGGPRSARWAPGASQASEWHRSSSRASGVYGAPPAMMANDFLPPCLFVCSFCCF